VSNAEPLNLVAEAFAGNNTVVAGSAAAGPAARPAANIPSTVNPDLTRQRLI